MGSVCCVFIMKEKTSWIHRDVQRSTGCNLPPAAQGSNVGWAGALEGKMLRRFVFSWKQNDAPLNRGHSNTHFGGIRFLQTYGNFGEVYLSRCLVWVGNLVTPVAVMAGWTTHMENSEVVQIVLVHPTPVIEKRVVYIVFDIRFHFYRNLVCRF